MYKYSLSKQSKKLYCPNCGSKTFTPYVDNETGLYVDETKYGRCDRENSCKYHKHPCEDADHNTSYSNNRCSFVIKEEHAKEPIRFSKDKLEALALETTTHNCLFEYVSMFSSEEALALEALKKYHVNDFGYKNDMCIFWQIDMDGEIHSGKAMRYNSDGHRCKDENKCNTFFLHKHKQFTDCVTGDELQQVFFGSHLLQPYKDLPSNKKPIVCIVESEKTALVMSQINIFDRETVWLATGGVNLLRDERIRGIKKYFNSIIIFPDNGASSWMLKANRHNCVCFNKVLLPLVGFKPGYDILDYLERYGKAKLIAWITNRF